MKKTSLYIDPEVDDAVGRLAEAEGKSKAEVIREAIAEKVEGAPAQPRITAIGVLSGPGDVSEDFDEYLAKSIADD